MGAFTAKLFRWFSGSIVRGTDTCRARRSCPALDHILLWASLIPCWGPSAPSIARLHSSTGLVCLHCSVLKEGLPTFSFDWCFCDFVFHSNIMTYGTFAGLRGKPTAFISLIIFLCLVLLKMYYYYFCCVPT